MAVEGKQAFAWQLQSSLMSLIANVNIPKGKKKTTPHDFNPIIISKPQTKQKKSVIREMAAMAGLSPGDQAKMEKLLAEKERRRNANS